MDFYQYPKTQTFAETIHTVAQRWALEQRREFLLIGEPKQAVFVGRNAAFNNYTAKEGVSFGRLMYADQCAMFIDGNSLVVNLSIASDDERGVFNKACWWFRAAFTLLKVPVKIGGLSLDVKGKTVGAISPPYKQDGIILTGGVIFFGYNMAVAEKSLKNPTFSPKQINGLRELGYNPTKASMIWALRETFPGAFGSLLEMKPFKDITGPLEELKADVLKDDWIKEGKLNGRTVNSIR